jgi:hypothetical protein
MQFKKYLITFLAPLFLGVALQASANDAVTVDVKQLPILKITLNDDANKSVETQNDIADIYTEYGKTAKAHDVSLNSGEVINLKLISLKFNANGKYHAYFFHNKKLVDFEGLPKDIGEKVFNEIYKIM